ncbi:hypothetical protein BJP36_36915 [Moorena producens JHB]|uniref:Uncharacterized protein n=1 Tax=Moorena producens (strain JHB) TaxID=1454205 RepID=A0A9Q9UWB3_MOOP1|nr:hypothetical protein [Moorena producens]WAN69678.1 hypothetical protein BJP36_36915 [Moorena producens JHB]
MNTIGLRPRYTNAIKISLGALSVGELNSPRVAPLPISPSPHLPISPSPHTLFWEIKK